MRIRAVIFAMVLMIAQSRAGDMPQLDEFNANVKLPTLTPGFDRIHHDFLKLQRMFHLIIQKAISDSMFQLSRI